MTFNKLQSIKRRFFAMRNGVVADTLRRAGSPFRIIFGLNVPQLVEIAEEFGPDHDLAMTLHDNRTTRESRLIAPMLMPKDALTFDLAFEWARDVETYETADILCHRLLRHAPFAPELMHRLADTGSEMDLYTALRLAANIMYAHPQEAATLAQAHLSDSRIPIANLARLITEETNFLLQK